MSGFVMGVLAGWLMYHVLMNRAAMFRACCKAHYQTHNVCKCADCVRDRDLA